MSGRPRSRSRSRSSGRSGQRSRRRGPDPERPWLRDSRSRSGSPVSRSRSRSPRHGSRSPRRDRPRRPRRGSPPPVRPVMSRDPKYLNSRVFVANLASDKTSNGELEEKFAKHGKVLDTLVHHNGYGFVQFASEEEGRAAVAAENNKPFHGKIMKCNMASEGPPKRGPPPRGPPGRDRGPPDDRDRDRFLRERDRSPLREGYPPPYADPYGRGRDPRDIDPRRDPLDPRRDRLDPRDLPPPPRDAYFDDPYRRPPPPDPYFDRFRDDPYRRDPYGPPPLDPFRDPYRDPYGPPLDFPPAPKKPVAVDCEIIIMTPQLRTYADSIDRRLKNLNLLTAIVVMREDRTVQQQVEDCSRRSCLFAIVINSQNEMHHSLTLNILHGVAQEHRNMPLDDAITLIAKSFEKFLQAEKEKVAALNSGGSSSGAGGAGAAPAPAPAPPAPAAPAVPSSSSAFLPPPKDIAYLLNLLADNRQLTIDELDKVIAYLKQRKDKMLVDEGLAPEEPKIDPAVLAFQQEQVRKQQEQKKQNHEKLQSNIFNIMNGSTSAAASTTPSMTHNSTAGSAAPLSLASLARAGPPPPPPHQVSPSPGGPGGANPASHATSPPSVSAVQGPAPAATLINFDNPSVQKALDNLIQSGPNLLRNISTSQAPPTAPRMWPPGGQGGLPPTSMMQGPPGPGMYPGQPRPPY